MSEFDIADCGSNSWNTYLSDINMCVADGLVAETLAVANYTCNKHNSSILSYRLVALLRSYSTCSWSKVNFYVVAFLEAGMLGLQCMCKLWKCKGNTSRLLLTI